MSPSSACFPHIPVSDIHYVIRSTRSLIINNGVPPWPGELGVAVRGRYAKYLASLQLRYRHRHYVPRTEYKHGGRSVDVKFRTDCGENLVSFNLTAITACQPSIRSESGWRMSDLLQMSRGETSSSIV